MLFRHIGRTFPVRVTEWILASILLSWGVILLHPDDSFALARFYQGMAALAPEELWGTGAVLLGSIRLVALAINGAWVPPTYYMRSICSFLSGLWWFTVSLELFMSGLAAPALAVWPWLFVLEMVTLYRTAREQTQSKLEVRMLRGEVYADSARG